MCGMCMCVGIIKARGERVTQKRKATLFHVPISYNFCVFRFTENQIVNEGLAKKYIFKREEMFQAEQRFITITIIIL